MADATKEVVDRTIDYSKDKFMLNPVPSFNFCLQVEGVFFMPLKSVRVFSKESEFDYYQEGGVNDYVHMLRKPISKPFTFQVERYVGVSSSSIYDSFFVDAIALGTELILPVILYVSRYPSYHFWENLNPETCARVYIFTGVTVTGKEYGELNAERSGLATETTTLAYRELLVINNISNMLDKGRWEFDREKDGEAQYGITNYKIKKDDKNETLYKGNNQYAYKALNTYSKANGEANAKADKWALYEDGKMPTDGKVDYKGVGNRHVDTSKGDKNNPSKESQSKSASEDAWNISPDDYRGTGKRHVQEDKGDRNNPSKKDQSTAGENNVWIYDGTVDGKGASHPENRNKNTKPTPVIWPPERRALMANTLSKK